MLLNLSFYVLSSTETENKFPVAQLTSLFLQVQGAVVEVFGHVEQLAWIGAGFPLGSVAVILFVTALFTSFNMKWIYITSILLFEVGSALCGAAPSMNAFIVGRVIAGAGGAGIYLGGLNYISALTTHEERGTYITLVGFCWGIGCILGPVVGGAFSVSSATWRWAFYINLVIGALTAPVYLIFLPPLRPVEGVSISARLAKFDFVGLVLGAGVWAAFTIALTMAGGQWPWNDGRTIATFIVLGVVLVLYVIQQCFAVFTTETTRSFPVHLIRMRTQVLLVIAMAGNVTTMFIVIYFIPIYFQFVHNDSALMAAIRLLPYVIITVTTNVLTGHFLARLRYYMPIYVVSGILITVGGTLLTVHLDPNTSEATIYGLTVVLAVGTGLTMQINYAIAAIKAPAKDMGNAISLQNITQIGCTVIALVIAGQVFQSTAASNLGSVLAGEGFSAQEIQAAAAGAQSVVFSQLTGELRDRAILAITQAMQKTFILVIVAGATLLVAGVFMKRERIFGK
jgi:MFS family permease